MLIPSGTGDVETLCGSTTSTTSLVYLILFIIFIYLISTS